MPKKGEQKIHCRYGGHELSGDNLHIEKDGKRRCTACRRNNYNKPRVSRKIRELKKRFWSLERYEIFIEAQQNCCAICKISFENVSCDPSADHDHANETPRGLLCSTCNTGLGMFKDNPFLLEQAAGYLRKYGK